MKYLLEINNLETDFITENGKMVCIDDLSFNLKYGEVLGIVGESGCGKSVTSLSIMRLLGNNDAVSTGSVIFEGENLLELSEFQMNKIRGNKMSMIFQDTMTSLNPVLTIGDQITETIKIHLKFNRKEARSYAVDMLMKVGLPRPEEIMNEYPSELSGGMRQRAMIAIALSCNPKLLIADEPTTALDVTIQAQIIKLMKELKEKSDMSIMLITHDIGVIAEMADKVIVMYAGQIIEEADVYSLFDNPKHPYTIGLMNSVPKIDSSGDECLQSIEGRVPSNYDRLQGCRFSTRCPMATEDCIKNKPAMIEIEKDHFVRCINIEQINNYEFGRVI